MKRTITILISLLLLSISAEAGVLRQLDVTQYANFFPDTLIGYTYTHNMNPNYSELVLKNENKYYYKLLFKGQAVESLKYTYNGEEREVISLKSKFSFYSDCNWIYKRFEPDKHVYFNLEKDKYFLIEQFNRKEKAKYNNNINYFTFIFNSFDNLPYISKNGQIFAIGRLTVWDSTPNQHWVTIFKKEGEEWVRCGTNDTLYQDIRMIFDNNDEMYFESRGKIFKYDSQSNEIIEIFDFYNNVEFRDFLDFDRMQPDPIKKVTFHPTTNELILTTARARLIILNVKSLKYRLEDEGLNFIENDVIHWSYSIIDNKGTIYFYGFGGLHSPTKYYFIVRNIDGSYEKIHIPNLTSLDAYYYFLGSEEKFYIVSNSRNVASFIYDPYTSDVEDDYHNKSLVFESPYPNPVGVESKVSGKFFAMPYLIKGLTMDLFDINGRKILDLSGNVNYNPATGLGNYSFSTLGLPRGMYYLIFNSSIYKDSKNIIVK